MSSIEEKKIINYVKAYYHKKTLHDDNSNKTSLNVLITTYFRHNKQIEITNIKDKRKFFFSYRTKYLNTFKKARLNALNSRNVFLTRKIAKEFKQSFSYEEWIIIDGDSLLKKLSLDDGFKSNKKDYERLKMIVEHVTKNYKLYKR